MKTTFAVLWVSVVSGAGFLGNARSAWSWTMLGAIAVLPPLVVMQRWRTPDQTISESIQEALR